MTDTTKPIADDKFSAVVRHFGKILSEHQNVSTEAINVFDSTNLTPRQLLDRLNFLQQGYSKTQHEIKQVLGKALGNYPWYKDDQKNFPNATDADGVCVGEHVAETIAEEAANVIVQLREQRDELADLVWRLPGYIIALQSAGARHSDERWLERDAKIIDRVKAVLAKCRKVGG